MDRPRAIGIWRPIESESDFVLQFRLPSPPPRFDWVADAPPAHFVAAIAGVVQLGTSVEDALNTMQNDRSRLPHRYDGAFDTIAGSIKFARAKLDQVEAAASDRQAVRLSRDIWTMLQEVVRIYFLAGQQAAMPGLIDSKYDAFAQAAARARRLPPPPQPSACCLPRPARCARPGYSRLRHRERSLLRLRPRTGDRWIGQVRVAGSLSRPDRRAHRCRWARATRREPWASRRARRARRRHPRSASDSGCALMRGR